jgi:hypothetical protein
MATITSCDNLATPVDTYNSVEVEMGGGEGSRAMDSNVAWVRIIVKTTEGGVQKGVGDLTKDGAGVWRGRISVSESGQMTFTATAGTQDASTGVYHVSWAGSAEKNVTGSGLILTIPVSAGDNTRHIFYENPNYATDGWRYLEAAPSDQSTGIRWSNIFSTAVEPSARGTAIGTGQANTTAIVGQITATLHCTSGAAYICDNLTYGGYSDWFLPSKDELNAMYGKRVAIDGFTDNFYLSSTEYDWYKVHGQNMSTGIKTTNIQKYDARRVRAIRAF